MSRRGTSHGAVALTFALGALAPAACASIGTEREFPVVVQTSGSGPFRPLTAAETGVDGDPPGRVLATEGATGGGMRAGDFFFHVHAPALVAPPERDTARGPEDVDWARFAPRRIERARLLGARQGFGDATVVLEAQAAWEGDAVFDPWVVESDGAVRLYYAAEGGIGLAEASSLDGTFTRVGDGPILADARGPTVVRDGGGGFWMFAQRGGQIVRASSSDGRAFSVDATLDLTRTDEGEGDLPEVAYGRPGAVWATTPTGRRVLRLYFEVVFEGGTRRASMAASLDGADFERLEGFVFSFDEGTAAPAPYLEDEVTWLYATVDHRLGDAPDEMEPDERERVRAPIVGVAPVATRFDP